MSTIKSSAENLTLNADGANNDIKFQSNGSEVASIDQAGTITATTFTGASTDATKLPLAGGTMTGALKVTGGDLIIDQSNNGYSGTRIHDDTGGDYNTFIDLGRNQGGTRLSIRAGGRTQGTSPWQNATPATIVSFANEGIAFHGDTAAANTLDDYEEGLHTTTATCSGGGTITLSSTNNKLYYTKIGRLVTVSGRLDVSAISSPSGDLYFSLPFSLVDGAGANGASAGSIFVWYPTTGDSGLYICWGDEATAVLYVRHGSGVQPPQSASHARVSTEYRINFSYMTA